MKVVTLFILLLNGAASVRAATDVTAGGTSIFDEAIPMLWTSKIVYVFAELLEAWRQDIIESINIPASFDVDKVKTFDAKFKDTSLDLTGGILGSDGGLAFNKIYEIIHANQESINIIRENDGDAEYFFDLMEKYKAREDQDPHGDEFFLETFRSFRGARQCVYGILKNTKSKRIIVVFRGSLSPAAKNRDWKSNFKAFLSPMKTPTLLKDKLTGKLKNRLLVHRGFYEYLFDNHKKLNNEERYETILKDIQKVLKGEEGYEIFVTGHSLGAALSSMASFQLAGEDFDWLPKPITCISYASPITGTRGFRTAFEQLEKDGMLRYLRVNNDHDFVPTLSPMSLSVIPRPMKHVGLNMRLYDETYELSHPSTNGFWHVLQNSIFKNPCTALEQHGLPTHEGRMLKHTDKLKGITIEDLYNDRKIVGFDVATITTSTTSTDTTVSSDATDEL